MMGRRANPSRWTIVGVLTGLSLVSYVERTNISVASKLIKSEFGLSDVQLGQVFSSFLIGYSLFQIPAGRLGDRFGPRLVLTLAALSWGVMTLLTGLLPGVVLSGTAGVLGTFFVLRLLLGVGESATYPVAARAIANWLPSGERARANAIEIAGASLGSAATPPLIAWLMVTIGWRQSFVVTSLFGFAIAAVWWYFARDRPPSVSAALPDDGSIDRTTGAWWRLFGDRTVLLLSLSYFVTGYVLYIFVFWLYTYLVDVRHFSVLSGGAFTSLPWLVSFALTPTGGALSDWCARRWGERWGRRAVAMGGLALSAGFLWYGATVANAYLAVAGLALAVGFEQFTEGTYWAATSNVAGRHAGAATGILNTLGNLGGVASTLLVPVLVKCFGWRVALGSGSLVALLGGLLWLAVDLETATDLSKTAAT